MKITIQQALGSYRTDCESRGLAVSYVTTSFVFLRKFRRACEDTARDSGRRDIDNLPVSAITADCISRYFTDLGDVVQSTRNRALVDARKFLQFLEIREHIRPGHTDRLLAGRKIRSTTRKPKYYIPVDQFCDLLDVSGKRHQADRAVIALGLYTLARQGEIASLKLKDVDLANNTIRIYRSKRKRWTDVTICPDLAEELDNWLGFYAHEAGQIGPHVMMNDHPDWHVVPHLGIVRGPGPYKSEDMSYELEPETRATRLEYIVKRALGRLGAPTGHGKRVQYLGEGMHTIRRSGARAMLDYLAADIGNDKALLQVSVMLDHDDPKMTLLYIDRQIERDRLNDYLKTGSMYGPSHRMTKPAGNVVPLRQQAG